VNDTQKNVINFAKADHKWYSVDEYGMKNYIFEPVDMAFVGIKEGPRNYGLHVIYQSLLLLLHNSRQQL
jgi:hypothetical protein